MSDSSATDFYLSPTAAEIETGIEPTPASIPANTEQFLRLRLLNTPVLLSVGQMTEVLTVPIGQIVPIAHMPTWVMGVYNWRGEVLWMVDLCHLCGLAPWYEQQAVSAHAAVVLQIRLPASPASRSASAKSRTLGLVVSQIGEMEWCDPHQIQALSLSAATPEITQFLRGYWWNLSDDMLAVLDGEAIAEAMP
ncbi:MAG: chemotaxis protein CheW [Drouetiella hepatica Uher 2000/2452]|uniref:Chemotaxis protein CheW n=1 Tax=Drouetiella hepatica Uher 2000/2452 TaxID=904376 RepID=A0A951ULM6_9CYAN|nr:chemotaxis protein CheW [Drouetiella hepatica Uher 2000/2452]